MGNDNKGASALPERWERFEQFSSELEPIITQLKGLMERYEIYPIDYFITFPVIKCKITAFNKLSTVSGI